MTDTNTPRTAAGRDLLRFVAHGPGGYNAANRDYWLPLILAIEAEAAHPDLLRIANEQWERGYAIGKAQAASPIPSGAAVTAASGVPSAPPAPDGSQAESAAPTPAAPLVRGLEAIRDTSTDPASRQLADSMLHAIAAAPAPAAPRPGHHIDRITHSGGRRDGHVTYDCDCGWTSSFADIDEVSAARGALTHMNLAESAALTPAEPLTSGSHELEGLDVERLARALRRVGLNLFDLQVRAIAAEYNRLAAEAER